MDEEKIDIEWKKCKNCGFLQYHSHLRCLKCKNDEFIREKAFGIGKLLSFTILKAPPMEYRDKNSYALGIIEFDNKVKAMGQIRNYNDLEVGMELKPVYSTVCKDLDGREIKSYIFEPIL